MPAVHPRVIPATPGHLITVTLPFTSKYLRTFTVQMYYKFESSHVPDYAELLSFANEYHIAFSGEIDDLMDHETFIVPPTVRYENLENIDITAISNENPTEGAKGGILVDANDEIESLPPQAALCIRKFTGLKGRANGGRLFIPFISEQVQHDGILDVINYVAAQEAVATMYNPPTLGGITLVPCHWNRKDSKLVAITQMGALKVLSQRYDRRLKTRPDYVMPAT